MTAIVSNEFGWYVGVEMTTHRSEMKFDSRDDLREWVAEDFENRSIDTRCIDHSRNNYSINVRVIMDIYQEVAATDEDEAKSVAELMTTWEFEKHDDNLQVISTHVEEI